MNTTPAPKFELRYVFNNLEDMLAFQSLVKGLADPVESPVVPPTLSTIVEKDAKDTMPSREKPGSRLSRYLPAMLEALDLHGIHLSTAARLDWMNIKIHDRGCEVSDAIKAELPDRVIDLLRRNYIDYITTGQKVYRNIPMAQRRFAYLLDHPDNKRVGARAWEAILVNPKYASFDKAQQVKAELPQEGNQFLTHMLEVLLSRQSLSKEAQKQWMNISLRTDGEAGSIPRAVSNEVSQRSIHQLKLTYACYFDSDGRCYHNIMKCKQRFAYTLDHPDLQKLGPKSWITIDRNPVYSNL